MPWFLIVAAILVLSVAMVLLMPKPHFENARASTLDDLRFPTAEEGRPVGLPLGTVRIRAPNVTWYGDFEAVPIKKKVSTGLFSSKHITVGYNYYIGMEMCLGLGLATKIKKIWIDKDIVWTGAVSASGTAIAINKPNLFGGKEQGGGFVGTLRFYAGTFTETVNAYLAGVITDPLGVPAGNGKIRIIAEHVNIGESPQLRPMSFELEVFSSELGLVHPTIGDDLNPCELLYQVLTREWGGMSVAPAYLNLASLISAGEVLYNEGNGMSLLVTNALTGKALIQEILRQIDGLLYQDPETSQIVLKLIRNDYDVLDLPVLDESNVVEVQSFASNSWTDTINQLRVTYTNRDNNYENGTAMAQDMANINAQLRLKTTTAAFPGITTGALANTVAHRELAQLCVPLFRITLMLNRTVADLRPGDVFIFSWDEYHLEQIVMRVMKFNMGELLNGKLVVEAIQDKFAVSSTVVADPSTSPWTPRPDQPADTVATRRVFESHYFFYQAASAQGNLSANQSGILVAAESPDSSAQFAEVDVSTDAGVTYNVAEDQLQFTARGDLQGAITATANLATGIIPAVTVSGLTAADLPAYSAGERAAGSGLFIIGGEYFLYTTVTALGGGSFQLNNVYRGLLDSAPAAHGIGDDVYILSGDNFIDNAYNGDAVLRVKLLTNTIDEVLDIATAPYDSITLKNRVYRPACPQDIKFNGGAAFTGPANPSVAVVITWANRSRLSQTVRGIADATSEYEAGQQTTIRYKINAGAWVAATYAPGVATATITTGATAGQTVAWEVFSTRDGLDSFNKWTFTSTGGGGAGSGGSGDSPDTGGSNPVDGTPGYTDISNKVSIVFPFGATIGTDSIDIPITFGMTVPAALAGTNADHDVNPTGTATFTFKKNGVTVATVAISAAGAYTLTAAAAFDLDPTDSFRCYPPAVADASLAGVSITIAAIRKP